MWNQKRGRELDILEILGLAGADEVEVMLSGEEVDTIYAIGRILNKPITPPDLSAALPSLAKICRESAEKKTSLIVKTDDGSLLYIVWGVIVVGVEETLKVSHILTVG